MNDNSFDKNYDKWREVQTFPKIDDKYVKESLENEFKFLATLTVEEYTLYKKWIEVKEFYPERKMPKKHSFWEVDYVKPELELLKSKIWIPENPEDYLKLEPKVICTHNNDRLNNIWTTLRVFISTMIDNPNIGRNLRFLVIDNVTQKYLGVIGCSSDFMDLGKRDESIGWSRDIKTNQKMINHTTIGSTIVPTQPLGYSFVGGKLLALLTASTVVEEAWNKVYKDRLVGITTTSLYGSFSQYNGLKFWQKKGHTTGLVKFDPGKPVQNIMKEWLRINYPKKYWEWYVATRESGMPLKRYFKQRSLQFTCNKLGITDNKIESQHTRGVYFCPLYNNTNEFLRKEITEKYLIRKFDNSIGNLVNIWKNKYAGKRIEKLVKENRYTTETLFYDGMLGKDWEEVKELYVNNVGR